MVIALGMDAILQKTFCPRYFGSYDVGKGAHIAGCWSSRGCHFYNQTVFKGYAVYKGSCKAMILAGNECTRKGFFILFILKERRFEEQKSTALPLA